MSLPQLIADGYWPSSSRKFGTQTFKGDPHWANVSLLIQPNANNTTYTTDETGKALTYYGNAGLSSASNRVGGKSLSFDGSGDYIQLADNSGWSPVGAYTAELIMTPAVATPGTIIAFNGGYTNWIVQSGNLYLAGNGSSWGAIINGAATFVAGQAVYWCWTWDGSTVRVFKNGVQTHSNSVSAFYDRPDPLWVGAAPGSHHYNGIIHAVRFTQGVARYTSNFTPPVAFPVGG